MLLDEISTDGREAMEKESEKRTTHNTNTAYIPTKCRVTKPPPPKPATNPLQFVKVNTNPLFRSAIEQVKKIEEVKIARQENVRDEAEDWQSNLDNWKSSRRKRQEHIIERVEEVKKLGQEEVERTRRKGTTFNEILEKRSKGSRPKFSIPLYDNDANDLSDYGIGSSSSKTNSIKDVDTDDNSSILDEKDNSYEETSTTISSGVHLAPHAKEHQTPQQQPQQQHQPPPQRQQQHQDNKAANLSRKQDRLIDDREECTAAGHASSVSRTVNNNNDQYTYEGAIQDYRSRIRSKINVSEFSSFEKLDAAASKSKEFAEAQTLLPKGNLFERMKMFQNNANDSAPARQICEDLINAQSIKERLQTLEKCAEQSTGGGTSNKSDAFVGNLKDKLNQFSNISDSDAKNNNPRSSSLKCDGYNKESEGPLNAAYDAYMEKLSKSAHLDSLYMKPDSELNGFRPSTSSSDLVTVSSDREDSGIHTTDVSCSVSQSDEPVEDADISVPHECVNIKTLTLNFLATEQQFSAKTHRPVVGRPSASFAQSHSSPTASASNAAAGNFSFSCSKQQAHIEDFNFYDHDKAQPLDSITNILVSPVHPQLKPPAEKPPPPPVADIAPNSSTARIKKELLLKRSNFLGLEEEPRDLYLEQKFNQPTVILDTKMLFQSHKPSSPAKAKNATSTTREEEIMKKEREIIELVEKEEKFKDHDQDDKQKKLVVEKNYTASGNNIINTANNQPEDIYLGNKKFDEPYYPEACYNDLDEQDSEVLKVEHELLQLEKEELKRQRENLLFQEKSAKLNKLYQSYDNMYYTDYHQKGLDYRKSMPELQNLPATDYQPSQVFPTQPVDGLKYQKSLPNIQQSVNVKTDMYVGPKYDLGIPYDHRKSMPNLEHLPYSGYTANSSNNNLLMPIKPLKAIERIDRHKGPIETEGHFRQSSRQIRYAYHHPHPPTGRSKSVPKEAWIQPKANPQAKSYNQHWLYQEAELRRLSEQKRPNSHGRPRVEKTIEQKPKLAYSDNKSPPKRSVGPDALGQKEYVNLPFIGCQQAYGHTLPMPFSPHIADEGHNVILSVSGKKKCSYCGNELGRGAAMIIESLSLFYHMECFKCCVCHMELGDGLMGTDVRVRNQKLHCHNCYSSDDGIKFSCV